MIVNQAQPMLSNPILRTSLLAPRSSSGNHLPSWMSADEVQRSTSRFLHKALAGTSKTSFQSKLVYLRGKVHLLCQDVVEVHTFAGTSSDSGQHQVVNVTFNPGSAVPFPPFVLCSSYIFHTKMSVQLAELFEESLQRHWVCVLQEAECWWRDYLVRIQVYSPTKSLSCRLSGGGDSFPFSPIVSPPLSSFCSGLPTLSVDGIPQLRAVRILHVDSGDMASQAPAPWWQDPVHLFHTINLSKLRFCVGDNYCVPSRQEMLALTTCLNRASRSHDGFHLFLLLARFLGGSLILTLSVLAKLLVC